MVSKLLKKNFNQFFTIIFCSIFFHSLVSEKAAQAQVSPDGSLPTEVNQSEQTIEITGGVKAGDNLFHSFEEFSIPTGQEAFFNNAVNITNIISRVTGNSVSEIDGLIRANGNANLFLLNPNGIVFEPNASLNIGGSFLATTAESLIFEDGTTFDTKNPQDSLLTINTPVGLQLGSGSGSIVNQSVVTDDVGETVGLKVSPGQNFTLIGGDIKLNSGYITAPGGQVNLGGLSAPGIVNFTNNDLSFSDRELLSDVSLDNISVINVRSGGNGEIDVKAKNFSLLNGSSLLAGIARGLGSAESRAGDINLDVLQTVTIGSNSLIDNSLLEQSVGEGGNVNIITDSLSVTNNAGIASINSGRGDAGDVNITTDSLSVTNNAGIASINSGRGDAGNINIEATDFISVRNGSSIQADTFGLGDAGNINIESKNADVSFRGVETGVSTSVGEEAIGQGGSISIKARSLTMTTEGDSNAKGALLETNTFGQGDAGNIVIKADNINFNGAISGASSAVAGEGIGQGGNIDIQARSFLIKNGALLRTNTSKQGDAGNIRITASDSLVISGTAPFPTLNDAVDDEPASAGGFASGLYAATEKDATGKGGDIRIDTNNLQLTDGAVLSSRSRSSFPGGNITVNASTLDITGGGQILTTAFEQGSAGNIILNVSDRINISGSDPDYSDRFNQVAKVFGQEEVELTIDSRSPESGVFAQTVGAGNAGNLKIVTDRLSVRDGGEIEVSAVNRGSGTTLGNAGNIEVLTDSIELSRQGSLEATASVGDGGNIFLQARELLILRNNSQISATAGTERAGGDGGNIEIDTDFLIASPLEDSDIIANAFEGDGGNISIDAQSIFGIERRTARNRTNDIDASSEFGLSGTVEIDTPDVDRDRDLVQLPERPTEREIVRACAPSSDREQSEFVIKGSGGLPPSPEDPLDSDSLEVDWVSRQPRQNSPKITSVSPKSTPIIEARGWIVNDKNEIILVADNSHARPWQNLPQCQQNSEGANHSLFDNNSHRNILIASNKPQSLTAKIPERISVNRFKILGNKALDSDELTEVLAPFTDKPLSFSELLQARSAITKYYTDRGYITSGAYIPQQRLQDKVVKIQIVEGYLEDIEITGNKRLNSKYFSRRIATVSNSLQQEQLLSALQLLQQDPLIETISAELETGTRPGANVLAVEVTEADSFTTPVSLDNRRTPSVGSFRRQLAINEGNLLGFGDNLFLAYSNTEGSDAFDGSYAVPINAHNGTLTLGGGVSSSEVVEEPFNQLNIFGDSHYYELSLRQPLIQSPTQEFALGITASRRESDISSLLEEFNIAPSELSPGADEDGQTRVSALRFFQEWTRRNSREVIAARSEFSLGLNIFDATVNEDAPDSRFFAWQGQAQWTRQISEDTSFLVRGGVQLATTSLLSSERFGLGGINTLRGYRQDLLLTDNSAFASAEVRLPIFRLNQIDSLVQLAPFVDLGTAWNNDDEREIESNTLASVGLGLRLSLFNMIARFDWGIPLVAVDLEEKTWQENGLHFSVEYSPF